MIRFDGVVKVLDFGIARRTHAGAVRLSGAWASASAATSPPSGPAHQTLTAQGMVLGTPAYMAPEQLMGESLDARIDQFAWGVVAYELFTGETPWQLDAGLATVLMTEPRPLGEIDPSIPRAMAAAVMRALSKEASARFPSMDALLKSVTAS
jgi:serine/threonine-protein kinase